MTNPTHTFHIEAKHPNGKWYNVVEPPFDNLEEARLELLDFPEAYKGVEVQIVKKTITREIIPLPRD